MALEPLNGRFGCSAVGHLHKAKAPGATGVAVSNDIDRVHHTIRLEELAKVMISGTKSKVTYKDIHAKVLFIVKNVDMNRQVIRTVRRSTKCKSYT
jgi:predicted regulator of Ras-like GTPase activity (Roadblock/LC7/MglB family)